MGNFAKKLDNYLEEAKVKDVTKLAKVVVFPKDSQNEILKFIKILEKEGYSENGVLKHILEYNKMVNTGIRIDWKPQINYDTENYYRGAYKESDIKTWSEFSKLILPSSKNIRRMNWGKNVV